MSDFLLWQLLSTGSLINHVIVFVAVDVWSSKFALALEQLLHNVHVNHAVMSFNYDPLHEHPQMDPLWGEGYQWHTKIVFWVCIC